MPDVIKDSPAHPMRPTKKKAPSVRQNQPILPPWLKGFLHPKVASLATLFLLLASGVGWLIYSEEGSGVIQGLRLQGKDLILNSGLTLQRITIKGAKRTNKKEIYQLLPPADGKSPLSALNLGALAERIHHLPWVKSVQITRQWPTSLEIILDEKEPLAVWQQKKDLFLIDISGEIIPLDNLRPYKSFPHVVGAGANKKAAGLLEALSRTKTLKDHVKSASYVYGRRWNLNLEDGVVVQLPQEGWAQAIKNLEILDANTNVLSKAIKFIDMRTSPQVVLRLKEEPSKRYKSLRSPTLKKKPKTA